MLSVTRSFTVSIICVFAAEAHAQDLNLETIIAVSKAVSAAGAEARIQIRVDQLKGQAQFLQERIKKQKAMGEATRATEDQLRVVKIALTDRQESLNEFIASRPKNPRLLEHYNDWRQHEFKHNLERQTLDTTIRQKDDEIRDLKSRVAALEAMLRK